MRKFKSVVSVLILFVMQLHAQQPLDYLPDGSTKIEGNYGRTIGLCIDNRIKSQDISDLIKPFTEKAECRYWQTEFWGKWMASAVAAYNYKPDAVLRQKINLAVKQLIATQSPNGYIGNYCDSCHMRGWDIWGRKYTMLGLLLWYQVTSDTTILNATVRLANHLMTETGPGKRDLIKTGNFRGMPSSTILEPMIMLYKVTKNQAYLRFCNYIIDQWERTPDGPGLISKALNNVDVAMRFPVNEKQWWSWENGQKAYEMMNCYKSLLDLYRIDPKPEYLEAVLKTANNIIATEINIAGSGASYECWYHGKDLQTIPATNTMETCVTFTWMQLCASLLSVTGDPKWAHQFELSAYNALPASMRTDGCTFLKYPPIAGEKSKSYPQPGMTFLNCCIANGPRGFMLVPSIAVMKSENKVAVNFYSQLTSVIPLDNKNKLTLKQITNYPVSGEVKIVTGLTRPSVFSLQLRVPEFSRTTYIAVNGEPVPEIKAGSYVTIARTWGNNDTISIRFDMAPRMLRQDHSLAFMYGPVVLARDQRFNKGNIDEVVCLPEQQSNVPLEMIKTNGQCQLLFKTKLRLGTYLEDKEGQPKEVILCDFASAGSTWDGKSRYRIWLPEILNPAIPWK